MRRPAVAVAVLFAILAISPARAVEASGGSWAECLKAPDRDCVLSEAADLVYLMDRTDRRAAVTGSIAETWAKAGEIDKAAQLEQQLPERLLIRITVLREIAAAQARAARQDEAQATFGAALQLAFGWKDPLERGEVLYAIAATQAEVAMNAAADITFDQALQAAAVVCIVGEKGRIVLPSPESRLVRLLGSVAKHAAETGDITQGLKIACSIPYDVATRVETLLAIANFQMRAGAAPEAALNQALLVATIPDQTWRNGRAFATPES